MKLLCICSSITSVFFLAACATKQETVSPKTEDNTRYNSAWTTTIPELKSQIRSCIISHKSTDGILYMDKTANETRIILSDNAQTYVCTVDNQSQKIRSITPTDERVPKTLPRFYPIGRTLIDCKTPEKQLDSEGRVMGTVCR